MRAHKSLAAVLIVTGCSSSTNTPSVSVSASRAAWSWLNRADGALRRAQDAADYFAETDAADACFSARGDVAALERVGPPPDQVALDYWQQAVTELQQVAADCLAKQYREARSQAKNASANLLFVRAQIGHLVS